MSKENCVVLGIAGMGGYAEGMRDVVFAEMQRAQPAVRLATVCDPDLVTFAKPAQELRERGIAVYPSLDEMLKTDIEAVWLPLPIDLHRPMTEKALAAGKAVLCEKPPAGCIDDLEAMIVARDKAKLPCAIAYQDIYDPMLLAVKRRIIAGEIGRVKSASVVGLWPREEAYYTRATWAGRMKRGGVWVLDSPANNAMSHYINLTLFLLGAKDYEPAMPEKIEAELYRANPIENYDTISLRATVTGRVPMVVLMSHACKRAQDPIVTITGEKGTVRISPEDGIAVNGTKGSDKQKREEPRPHMLQRFANLVRGKTDDRAVATLELTRAHMITINGASEAAVIHDIPKDMIEVSKGKQGTPLHAIKGLEDAMLACARDGTMLHESSMVEWSRPGGSKDVRGYKTFAGPKK